MLPLTCIIVSPLHAIIPFPQRSWKLQPHTKRKGYIYGFYCKTAPFLASLDKYAQGANVVALPSALACDKTFHMMPKFLTLWPWPSSLTYFWKTLTLAINFKPEVIELSYCICVFLVTRPFTWYQNFLPCDLDLEVWSNFEKLKPCLLFSDDCRSASVIVLTILKIPVKYLNFHEWLSKILWRSRWHHKFGHFVLFSIIMLKMARFYVVFSSVSIERGLGQI